MMGDVVSLAAFRERKKESKPVNALQLSEATKIRVRALKDKLIELEHILHTSPSVYSREKAVVDSIGVREELLGLIT